MAVLSDRNSYSWATQMMQIYKHKEWPCLSYYKSKAIAMPIPAISLLTGHVWYIFRNNPFYFFKWFQFMYIYKRTGCDKIVNANKFRMCISSHKSLLSKKGTYYIELLFILVL